MRRRLIPALALVSAALGAPAAAAQVVLPQLYFTSRQALESAYPQVGIAAAGGSPVLGTEGTRGVTLGFIPKTTGTLRLNAARLRLPDARLGASVEDVRTSVATVVKLETATRLFDGFASGTATVGSLDLLLDAGLVPGTGELRGTGTEFGAGARLGLLRETFGTPGVALSAVVRHTSRLRHGDGEERARLEFPVTDLGSRLTVGKRVGPVGLLGGVGWNRFSTRGRFLFDSITLEGAGPELELDDSRWSLFADLAWALPVGSLVVEGGWMSGGDAISGYEPAARGFDPGDGTVFGSLGLRISL